MHYTRLTKLIPFLFVAAVTLPPAIHADEPDSRTAPAATVVQMAQRYVLASQLNLRDQPAGKKVGRLNINSPVEVLEERGTDVRVRTKNDAEGWVPAQFLGDKPVVLSDALVAARSAETAEERLSWAQRAAAIDARHRQALEVLADAYRAVGDEPAAKAIDQRLIWPDDILLAGYAPTGRVAGQIALEWGLQERATLDAPASLTSAQARTQGGADVLDVSFAPDEGFTLTPAEMKKRGVGLGKDVWVLPERSAAVKGTVAGMRLTSDNRCENSWLWVLDVKVTLPEGERPVAYTIKSPPRTWKAPAPARDFDAARAAVQAEAGPGFTTLHVVAAGDGVGVQAVRDDLPPPKQSDAVLYTIRDYHLHADGTLSLQRSWVFDDWMSTYDGWWVGRDLDADGRIERVDASFCRHILYDADGVMLDQSALRCCTC